MQAQTPSPASEPIVERTVEARDGRPLAATFIGDPDARRVAIVSSAMAVPQRFYRRFALGLARRGYLVITWDYRDTGRSGRAKPGSTTRLTDWMVDQQGVVDTARALGRDRMVLIGHSLGGQIAGLLEDPRGIDGMVTLSSQSGHWRLQGGLQPLSVFLHVHLTLPVLSTAFGYMPWSWFGAEDLPKGVALDWARWCRDRRYLRGDDSLPLERFAAFPAPVLAYSFEDDTWGTARAVDAMMQAYPRVERCHVRPAEHGLDHIGHFGFFRPSSVVLWEEVFAWLDAR